MHPFERWVLLRYLATALASKRYRDESSVPNELITWIADHYRVLQLPYRKPKSEYYGVSDEKAPADFKVSWQRWRATVIEMGGQPQPEISPLQKRIDWLSGACELNRSQCFLLGLFARIALVRPVCELVCAVSNRYRSDCFDYSELSYFSDGSVERRDLSAKGLLSRFGLIDKDEHGNFSLSDIVESILTKKKLNISGIRALLLGKPAVASLGWEDFSHLGELRDTAARILYCCKGTNGTPVEGINILIYGAPGTGKSEFVKTLGAHLGNAVHFIGEENGRNEEPTRHERIAALLIANALGAADKKMIIAVDEADDLFAGVDEDNAATRHGSKVFMNRLVEHESADHLDRQRHRTSWSSGRSPDEPGHAVSKANSGDARKNGRTDRNSCGVPVNTCGNG